MRATGLRGAPSAVAPDSTRRGVESLGPEKVGGSRGGKVGLVIGREQVLGGMKPGVKKQKHTQKKPQATELRFYLPYEKKKNPTSRYTC